MNAVLIGGPRDGERLELEIDPRLEVIELRAPKPPIHPIRYDPDVVPSKDVEAPICHYRRQVLRDGDRRHEVWVHEAERAPVARLLAGYRVRLRPCEECATGGRIVGPSDNPHGVTWITCPRCQGAGYVEEP